MDQHQIAEIRGALGAWREACGTKSKDTPGYSSGPQELNQILTAEEVDELCDRIDYNLSIALKLIDVSDRDKFISNREKAEEEKRRQEEEDASRQLRANPSTRAFMDEILARVNAKRGDSAN